MDLTVREWLFDLELVGIKLGLDQMQTLLARLDHPERSFESIAIAGTNGKGSVAAIIERGLRAAGRRTGRYTSPHLVRIEERVVVAGSPIEPGAFDQAAQTVRGAAEHLMVPPSFFEATTALALVAFRDAGVEVAVLEVGLGGRLDATNAVDARLAIITNIGLDHEAHLGHTIEAIAGEKAGIIKPDSTVVVGKTTAIAAAVIASEAGRLGGTLRSATDGVVLQADVHRRHSTLTLTTPRMAYGALHLALAGRHQVDNAVTAVRALEEAHRMGLALIDKATVRTALQEVRWPGRLDWRRWHGHEILIDGAHNPDAAQALAEYLTATVGRPVPLVLGMMKDKNVARVMAILAPCASTLILTAPTSRRAASPEALVPIAEQVIPDSALTCAASPDDALDRAVAMGGPVVVAGSLFLAGEVLRGCE